jgi:tetratricopeptide (TPR) repeat protein
MFFSVNRVVGNLAIRASQIKRIHKFRIPNYGRYFASLPNANESALASTAQVLYSQGVEKWTQDDLVGAQQAFEQSIEVLPSSDAYFNLANVYHNMGNHVDAIKYWEKSLESSPRADAMLNIANVQALVLKDFESACRNYENAIKLSPEDGEINYNYGVVLDAYGKLEQAIEQYSIAVSWGIEVAEKNLRNARAKWVAKNAQEKQQ